jgi:hypothetical protein
MKNRENLDFTGERLFLKWEALNPGKREAVKNNPLRRLLFIL